MSERLTIELKLNREQALFLKTVILCGEHDVFDPTASEILNLINTAEQKLVRELLDDSE